jgi:hypothetical protein
MEVLPTCWLSPVYLSNGKGTFMRPNIWSWFSVREPLVSY